MLLLTGPAGSGKTHRVLDQFRAALQRCDSTVRLLTPTATMAQHLQNQLAREGFVFRPALIRTLSHFVDSYSGGPPPVSEPLLYLIVEQAARRVNHPDFARVVRLPGFCAALARTIAEFSAAGCGAERLAQALPRPAAAPLAEPFLAVYREVDRDLLRRGFAMRSQRLIEAAERITREGLPEARAVWLDGFYALPDPELALIAAISRHADITLALPDARITAPTRQRLLAMGFVEQVCRWEPAPPRTGLCEAPSIEREADEIARRILAQAAAGRAFREMGVIVRSPELYAPVLRATFDRFGVPARFYFDADLSQHALVRYLAGVVDALLVGWDHAETLAALRAAPGLVSDEFDFAVRVALPGRGLAGLQKLAEGASAVVALLASFEKLESWPALSLASADWAVRLQGLRALFRPGRPEPVTYQAAEVCRSQADALNRFDAAMDEAALALAGRRVSLHEFWRAAKSVLRLTPLRAGDRRRNVAHVLSAHEARQWRLPVVFVCGLAEKQFPRFHPQEPFFPEAARAQLQQAGIRIRTVADFEAEERFLFDCAVTRATEALTLSYARFDPRGQQNLPSLYLEGVAATPAEWQSVRPQAGPHDAGARPPAAIAAADLLQTLAIRHRVLRPTALESFLQCPFQFFGRHTLHLEEAPPPVDERLTFMVEGTIVHEVLAAMVCEAQPLEEVFDRVFRRVTSKARIPPGYRTEACRERLLADLRRFAAGTHWPPGFQTRAEQQFQFPLAGGVEIKGRIDRLDVTPDGRAFVIDYKYSSSQNTKKRLDEENCLQPQLYVLAAERAFGLPVAGMFYCGLRGGVTWAGWSVHPAVDGVPFPPQWREQAIEATERVAREIRAGRVAPHPADPGQCPRCDYRDVCRIEAAAALAGGS